MNPLDPIVEALKTAGAPPDSVTRLATITQVGYRGVFVRFDGETTASGREYERLDHVGCIAGDRVLLVRTGSTWVCIGIMKTTIWEPYTPTIRSSSGIAYANAVAWGRWQWVGGDSVAVVLKGSIEDVGSQGGTAVTMTLPFTAVSSGLITLWAGRESRAGGAMLQGTIGSGWNDVMLFDYANNGIAANARDYVVSGVYEIQR